MHFRPSGWQMRIESNSVLSDPDACHTEDRRLPEPSERRHVDAACSIAHVVDEVNFCGLTKIAQSELPIPQPSGDKGVERWTQRAAVRCPGLVVIEVCLMDSPRPFVP